MRALAARLWNRRRWLAVLAALSLLAGLAVAVVPRDRRQEPVSVHAQIGEFRAGRPAPTPAGAPPAGVYVYDTEGFEEARLLAAARHRYPGRTTITVTGGGCGVLSRWSVLSDRWTRTEACRLPGGRWRLRAETDVHEFFGHRDERTYRCAPGSLARPPGPASGGGYSARCVIRGTRERQRAVVLGAERVAVGGAMVAAVRVRVRTTILGDTTGSGTTDLWLRISDGLVLRRRERNQNATRTFAGTVRYTERYELRLRSLRPRR